MRRGTIDDAHVTDSLAGYLLGSLPDEEILVIAKHVSECGSCLRDLEELAVTRDDLFEAAPEAEPPEELWDRVRDRVRWEIRHGAEQQSGGLPAAGTKHGTPAPNRIPRRPDRTRRFRLAGVAVAAALIIGLGTSTAILARMAVSNPVVLPTIAMNATVGSDWGTDGRVPSGMIVVSKNGEYGTLVVDNLKRIPDGQYQLWLIRNGTRTSGAVFSVNTEGYANVAVISTQSLTSFSRFGITAEPVGGSPDPTGVRVLAGALGDR